MGIKLRSSGRGRRSRRFQSEWISGPIADRRLEQRALTSFIRTSAPGQGITGRVSATGDQGLLNNDPNYELVEDSDTFQVQLAGPEAPIPTNATTQITLSNSFADETSSGPPGGTNIAVSFIHAAQVRAEGDSQYMTPINGALTSVATGFHNYAVNNFVNGSIEIVYLRTPGAGAFAPAIQFSSTLVAANINGAGDISITYTYNGQNYTATAAGTSQGSALRVEFNGFLAGETVRYNSTLFAGAPPVPGGEGQFSFYTAGAQLELRFSEEIPV